MIGYTRIKKFVKKKTPNASLPEIGSNSRKMDIPGIFIGLR